MSQTAYEYLRQILTARVYDVAIETPLEKARNLSARLNNTVLLKREDLQPVFSFKIRGAYNKIAKLKSEVRSRGVICASAGNHGQGVAWSARALSIRAVVVMPQTAPGIKVDAVRALGGEVILFGESFDDAYDHARALAKSHKLTFIHPYDDPDIIAGQGTIGLEILRQHSQSVEAVFCAVGGGGLIAGVATYIKQIRPEIKVIGVEAVDAAGMFESLAQGRPVKLNQVGLFADGAAVKLVGAESFRLCQAYVDQIVLVDNDAICAAIKDVFEDTRSILEPAGALSVAGAKAWLAQNNRRHKTIVAVTSGANMNFDRLRFVAERAELGDRREAILAVVIPEQPGSFKRFCALLGGHSITEFNYRYGDNRRALIFVGLAIQDRAEVAGIIKILQANSLETVDLTANEMAKLHIRHMVGGHAPQAEHEVVYRFIFPERPGALLQFLDQLGNNWNISLFHYRNHGADFGRVLIGLQVPPAQRPAFNDFLNRVGYEFVEETVNPAYRLFLGHGQ